MDGQVLSIRHDGPLGEGIVTEIPWDLMDRVREVPGQWLLSGRSFCVALPKRAVPPERAAELGGFLRSMADRRPGDSPG
ncbi:YcxB family protein [Actinomadura monticuli]|uniref:YcxB family protein n=1 Tax=Actinomadura monticuli TaxID=3097367 RepID=A0ABV4QJT5_9ACTN